MSNEVPAWAYGAYADTLQRSSDQLKSMVHFSKEDLAILDRATTPASQEYIEERLRAMDPEKRATFLRTISVPVEFGPDVNPRIARMQQIIRKGLAGENPAS